MSQFTSQRISSIIEESIETKKLFLEHCSEEIRLSGELLIGSLRAGGKLLFCGNGGSAADCQHIAAELTIRYRSNINRPAIPAISLTVDPSMMTAGGNDIGYENVFARLVEAYAKPEDVLIGITTSGNSENVLRAIVQAQSIGAKVVCLLGNGGGKILPMCDSAVTVPSSITARVQECHILAGHIWCEMIEEALFPEMF